MIRGEIFTSRNSISVIKCLPFYFLLEKKKLNFPSKIILVSNFPIFFFARWKTIKNLFLTITINHFHAFILIYDSS